VLVAGGREELHDGESYRVSLGRLPTYGRRDLRREGWQGGAREMEVVPYGAAQHHALLPPPLRSAGVGR
jgi:hypothetical protein